MTIDTAFATPVTGTSFRPGSGNFAKTVRRPACASKPATAVLGRPAAPPTWSISAPPQTFEVTVQLKNKTVAIEVDRETDLREALLSNGVDVYTLGGKLRNCGGGGQCGTCLISVEDNIYNVNGRSAREEFVLQGKPASWRLACRTNVTGPVTIRTKPQA